MGLFDQPQGQPAAAAPASQPAEAWELRTVSFSSGEPKPKKDGTGVYYRFKDQAGVWYSVWEEVVARDIDVAMSNGESIPCAVQVKISNTPGRPFLAITATRDAARYAVEEGKQKTGNAVINAPTSGNRFAGRGGGGNSSPWSKRMHPNDAARAGTFSAAGSAALMVQMCMPDKPDNVSCKSYVLALHAEFTNYIFQLADQREVPVENVPVTTAPPLASAAGPAAGPPQQDFEPGPPEDADIPF